MERPFLVLENLSRRYPGLTIFENLNLNVARGEFICLVGHSGCGKSTILNIVAGMDQATEGYVFVNQREVSRPGLDRGVIFQNHNLLPWRTALQNVMFAVRARWPKWSRDQIEQHSRRFIEMVGLNGAEDRKPAQLSGGMRQRVGIARAFALEPQLLLMDEPFGALDALTRGQMQDELLRIWERTGQTVLMITHDVDEAILLADRVLLMSSGPNARIAESVAIELPRPRDRRRVLHEPTYYALRNRMVDFLITHGSASHRTQETSEQETTHEQVRDVTSPA
jgi:nitrate/nitrite transport system ATP-binding protein